MGYLGGAWTPSIVWYLSGGPRRFSELEHDLAGVSAKMLAQRLRQLVGVGILTRVEQPTSPPTVEYALTDLGRELKPAIDAIVSVGRRLKILQNSRRGAADAEGVAEKPTGRRSLVLNPV